MVLTRDEVLAFYGIAPLQFHGFILRELVEGKLLVSLRVRVAARYTTSIVSFHRLLSWLCLAAALL